MKRKLVQTFYIVGVKILKYRNTWEDGDLITCVYSNPKTRRGIIIAWNEKEEKIIDKLLGYLQRQEKLAWRKKKQEKNE